jgi:hypothetical protein
MNKLLFLSLSTIFTFIHCNDNLRVAYQWKQIDFDYRNNADRMEAIEKETFIPQHVIPVGLEVYKQRLFITLPRWKTGVPASLAYIDLNGESKKNKSLP